jgi:NitT/TauT family transport system substrate-binding protein
VDAAVLSGSAFTLAQRRFPKLTLLVDTRTAEGTKALFGAGVYPAYSLLAPTIWLRENSATAHKLALAVKRATDWIREHSPEEIRARMPPQRRSPDVEADLEALRATIPMLSAEGTVSAEGAEIVRKVLALSVEKVRITPIDLSQTYTNEFIWRP